MRHAHTTSTEMAGANPFHTMHMLGTQAAVSVWPYLAALVPGRQRIVRTVLRPDLAIEQAAAPSQACSIALK